MDQSLIELGVTELSCHFLKRYGSCSLSVDSCPSLSLIARWVFEKESVSERDLNNLVFAASRLREKAGVNTEERALLRGSLAFLFCRLIPTEHDYALIFRGNPGIKPAKRDTKQIRDTWAFMNYKRSLLFSPEQSYTSKSGQTLRPKFKDTLASALRYGLGHPKEFREFAIQTDQAELASRLIGAPNTFSTEVDVSKGTGASEDIPQFISETVPDGSLFPFDTTFTKSWTVKNAGTVPWLNRAWKRVTPMSPLFPRSPELVKTPPTHPGETVTLSIEVTTTALAAFSEVRYKMVHENGELCWPDDYSYGLTLFIETRDLVWIARRPGDGSTPWVE
ncbi:NBR1-Ig-like domain-containing protein [Psychromicrobium sp. YIM B11713]|uniref:NBR1-Ig-like domain-containing protein n=1 Tax=Psychromicrobium sp. YIM B11713 TaxID=3145233 RepID=UPI00374F6B8D